MYVLLHAGPDANIRGGTPLTSSLNICQKPAVEKGVGLGESRLSHSPPPFSQRIHGYFIKRRRNRCSPPRCFLNDFWQRDCNEITKIAEKSQDVVVSSMLTRASE
jgi:hypothetical protein